LPLRRSADWRALINGRFDVGANRFELAQKFVASGSNDRLAFSGSVIGNEVFQGLAKIFGRRLQRAIAHRLFRLSILG
jgi:hypothetical protein